MGRKKGSHEDYVTEEKESSRGGSVRVGRMGRPRCVLVRCDLAKKRLHSSHQELRMALPVLQRAAYRALCHQDPPSALKREAGTPTPPHETHIRNT